MTNDPGESGGVGGEVDVAAGSSPAKGRAKVVRLYARGMGVPDDVLVATVRRTEGVSASFIKELMRRSAQFQLERDGPGCLSLVDVEAALDELLFKGGSLNRKLLGGRQDAPGAACQA